MMQQEGVKGFQRMKAFEQSTTEMAGQVVGSDGVVEGGLKQPLDTLRDALKLAGDDSTKSNDDFRKMMEEAEAGVFQSKKVFQPPAVSTKTLGTWEKHTKGAKQLGAVTCREFLFQSIFVVVPSTFLSKLGLLQLICAIIIS
jgi:hypothetical protein